MEHIIRVEGMSCNHCVQTITKAINKLDATANIEIDLKTGVVKVNSTLRLDVVEACINEAGYDLVK